MDEKVREKYMRQALRLAARGAGKVSPNPQVGAVIVRDGQVIGSGYHKRFGAAHAEVEAIKSCSRQGRDPAGGTMFVTLEPCCHHGKTPPCTEAIAKAGISLVEIAILDECELVDGKGVKWLREHDIEVRVGCCRKQARQINAGFFQLQKTGRPQVILKWAQSIDGKLAWPSESRQRWLTNEKSRQHVHRLRSRCGAILVGIGTVLADDPLLTVRLEKKSPQPRRVVLDSRLRIPLDSQLVRTAHETPTQIYTLQDIADQQWKKVDALDNYGCQVRPVSAKDERVDLEAVLKELGGYGVTDLLVEGGATILNAFWRSGLAEKVMVYIAPIIIGGVDVASIDFTDGLVRLKDVSTEHLEGDTLIEGYVEHKQD